MTRNFQNKEKYRKWLAFGWIHHVMGGGHQKIEIHGHTHHVNHGKMY
jgi:hypothetical protein